MELNPIVSSMREAEEKRKDEMFEEAIKVAFQKHCNDILETERKRFLNGMLLKPAKTVIGPNR